MAIFLIQSGNVKKIPPIKVGLERDIQKIFEENLNEILNITFLASEYSTSFGGRIDSLGIADFEVLVQKAKINIDIDWASPRVICIAESYNK